MSTKYRPPEGFTLWFTGWSGAGKTTLAIEVEKALHERGIPFVQRLDGDIVRQDLTRDLGFSREDRNENIRRVTFVAELLSKNGVATLVSFISPYREAREKARTRFQEVSAGIRFRFSRRARILSRASPTETVPESMTISGCIGSS